MPTLNELGGSFYDHNHVFFILEAICVMAFAVSFILKGHGQLNTPAFNMMAGQPPGVKRAPANTGNAPTEPPRESAGRP